MVRLGRIWKLYITYTIVLLVCMIAGGLILQAKLKGILEEHLTHEVLTLTKVIVKNVPDTADPAILDPFCQTYGAIAGVRITIIDADGTVIGESDRKSMGMEKHLDRIEVKGAISTGIGTSVRHSGTLGIDMLYVASRLEDKGKIIRLSMPMAAVKAIEDKIMIFLTFGLYLTPIVAVIISFFFTQYMVYRDQGTG
jgi:two-component system phosphate regulon sensor histidine kinase PhoR